MPGSDNEKRFFTLPRVLGGLSVLVILVGIALIVVSALSLLALPIFWPILILAAGLWGIFASVVLSKSSDKPSRVEDVPKQPATEFETLVSIDTANSLDPQIAQTQIFVRYQEAFPTVAEVKEAVAKGEVIYQSDHLPILFETSETTILSYNILGSDSANGFADASKYHDNDRVGEYQSVGQGKEIIIQRNQQTFEKIRNICDKYQPDILCLQECVVPEKDKDDPSKCKFNVGLIKGPTFVELPGYQFKAETVRAVSYNGIPQLFQPTVTLFSDNFLSRYDVELDSDRSTWKCTDKTDPHKILKIFNGHILHQNDFGLTESKIKRQLMNSLAGEDSGSQVISFNVGDFNNRVAPVNDNQPQNLTECVRAACCTQDKIQSCASGSGAYKAIGTQDNPHFEQVKGTFIDPRTAKRMSDLPPLDTSKMPASQKKEVNKIEPVMCIDRHYEQTKIIDDKTIFEYEDFLRKKLEMKAPNEPSLSNEALLTAEMKSIVLLESSEKIPDFKDAEKGTIYLKKTEKSGLQSSCAWREEGFSRQGHPRLREMSIKASSEEIIGLFNGNKKIERSVNETLFLKAASSCGYLYAKQGDAVLDYDDALKQLLFVRSGATINNERCLVVVLPKDHQKSKQLFDDLKTALGHEKTILFEAQNSWFMSKTPTLINYQISIPLDKVDAFHAAVMKHFNLALTTDHEARSGTSSTSSISPKT